MKILLVFLAIIYMPIVIFADYSESDVVDFNSLSPIDDRYIKSNWGFSAPAPKYAHFYFWKDKNNKYFFQYLNINVLLSSAGITANPNCYAGLKGELNKEEIKRLKEIINKIKNIKNGEKKSTTPIMATKYIFKEKNGKDIKKYYIDFYSLENGDELLNEFYTFFNKFRGKSISPCPSWTIKVSTR
jgi:hypothetical protein